MISRNDIKEPKKRILSVCVQMFIEKGYKQTTMLDILKESDVSAGTFQNIFHTKDGVLLELIEFMFNNQFSMARNFLSESTSIEILYAIETAIQLTIVELNENLREIYLEAYTQPKLIEYINQKTSSELAKIFSKYNLNWTESDFYEVEIATSGIMRSFMAKKCDKYFTLNKKINLFLKIAFDVYHVSEAKQIEAIEYISKIDMIETSNKIMKKLFSMLEMTFDFKFSQ